MDAYEEIALELPNEVRIGGALITMVEPEPGYEAAYNRWYEDDHFYSGAMHGPWIFAGRRWVAPRALRTRRVSVDSSAVQPPDAGCYISVYWFTEGHEDEVERWSYLAMAEALMPHEGRGFSQRTHVYTAFHRYRFGLVRDAGPMKPHLALHAAFEGLLVEVIDAPSEDGMAEHLPAQLQGSPAALVTAFTPVPFAQGRIDRPGTSPVPLPEGVGKRLCLLWFLDRDPYACIPDAMAAHHRGLADSKLGSLRFSGPFIPTIVGTDRYVDELR
jgi:hypothetical protein